MYPQLKSFIFACVHLFYMRLFYWKFSRKKCFWPSSLLSESPHEYHHYHQRGFHDMWMRGWILSQAYLPIWEFCMELKGFSTGKSFWGMVWFQMIEECAVPKVPRRDYIPIEAPHTDNRSRCPKYCNILSNRKISRGLFNPCFTAFNRNWTHQPWCFETSQRKEEKR